MAGSPQSSACGTTQPASFFREGSTSTSRSGNAPPVTVCGTGPCCVSGTPRDNLPGRAGPRSAAPYKNRRANRPAASVSASSSTRVFCAAHLRSQRRSANSPGLRRSLDKKPLGRRHRDRARSVASIPSAMSCSRTTVEDAQVKIGQRVLLASRSKYAAIVGQRSVSFSPRVHIPAP